MEFRSPTVALQQNAKALTYLTKNLKNRAAGCAIVEQLIEQLGNAVDYYPDWHPILTAPPRKGVEHINSLSQLEIYQELDHTTLFVRGFVTCPYSDDGADKLVSAVNQVAGLNAYRLHQPLYAEGAYPVVVVANSVELEADGTIRSRDALTWFAQQQVANASSARLAETWWNIRSRLLGGPHGSRSSLFVNQHTGNHMRKILEAMNASGMFGEVKEDSLEMLSQKKRNTISETLIRSAVAEWEKEKRDSFTFELRGEKCRVSVRDTWGDNEELSIRVNIREFDLFVSGFFYPENRRITHSEPRGKRALAEKFI
jgi:hypothetical protein